jgi:hypothetical protein
MEERKAVVMKNKSSLYPECFEEVVVANIDSPEFTKFDSILEKSGID